MAGQMIPGFDAAVEDMAVGEKKTVHIPAAEAYGERNDEMVQKVPVDQIPNADQLPVGQTVYMMGPGGQRRAPGRYLGRPAQRLQGPLPSEVRNARCRFRYVRSRWRKWPDH